MPSSDVIGEHFETFIKNQIKQGRYASASEVIRDGLRSLEDRGKFRELKLEALRAEIQKGADSGAGIPAATERWPLRQAMKVKLSPIAKDDMLEIALYIAQDNPVRALSFVTAGGGPAQHGLDTSA